MPPGLARETGAGAGGRRAAGAGGRRVAAVGGRRAAAAVGRRASLALEVGWRRRCEVAGRGNAAPAVVVLSYAMQWLRLPFGSELVVDGIVRIGQLV